VTGTRLFWQNDYKTIRKPLIVELILTKQIFQDMIDTGNTDLGKVAKMSG